MGGYAKDRGEGRGRVKTRSLTHATFSKTVKVKQSETGGQGTCFFREDEPCKFIFIFQQPLRKKTAVVGGGGGEGMLPLTLPCTLLPPI